MATVLFNIGLLFLTEFSITFSAAADCYDYSRSDWNAKSPNGRTNLATPVAHIYIHHTETPTCNSKTECSTRLRSIQAYHQNSRNWSDIGYNFLIGGDGKVYEGRGWKTLGAHTLNHNSNAIGISFIGDFQTNQPPESMLNAAKALIACGVKNNYIKSDYTLQGHRDVNPTTCPGDKLYSEIKKWPHFIGKSG